MGQLVEITGYVPCGYLLNKGNSSAGMNEWESTRTKGVGKRYEPREVCQT
jgi:hypothetical protein